METTPGLQMHLLCSGLGNAVLGSGLGAFHVNMCLETDINPLQDRTCQHQNCMPQL